LSAENEPIIWNAIKSGAIVENVSTEKGGMKPDFSDLSITENGRCSYPLDHVQKRCIANQAGEPKNVIFLTCDVSGVLPPVSVLSKEAAAFHFLSGYTAKVGSTELGAAAGINPTFSTCFGAPFMPRRAGIYAKLLMDRIEEFGSSVYLVNTGWTGGAGDNGKRFPIPVTRAIITAITQGQLQDCKMEHLDTLNLDIPLKIDGVDSSYLNPRSNWKSVDAYDHQAKKLAKLFVENIVDFNPSEDVLAAGPQI
jgi:phosphoenolpyruvate carboxykinase (ATP)